MAKVARSSSFTGEGDPILPCAAGEADHEVGGCPPPRLRRYSPRFAGGDQGGATEAPNSSSRVEFSHREAHLPMPWQIKESSNVLHTLGGRVRPIAHRWRA